MSRRQVQGSLLNELLAFCEGGEYFKATNATFGTGIAMGIRTAFSATANVLALMRSGSARKLVIPHYVRLICTAAGASATSCHLGVIADTGDRYSSGGTDLLTGAKNARGDLDPTPAVDVLRFGDVTAAAAVAARQLVRSVIKTQAADALVVGDEILINFLAADGGGQGLKSGAAAGLYRVDAGPVMLAGANHSLLVHMWNPDNAVTPPSWECEFAWWERLKD